VLNMSPVVIYHAGVTSPLSEPALYVLAAVADEPRHGYALLDEVERASGGRLRLRTGSLYALLDRLRRGGLVEVDRQEVVASRLRRYYRITGAGATVLAAQAERLAGRPATEGGLRGLGLGGAS
jgi:DNA-binding PadR family transcriptional regulator